MHFPGHPAITQSASNKSSVFLLDPHRTENWKMKLWSTLIVFAAAWAVAVAWPNHNSERQLLETFLQDYLESDLEVLMNEGEKINHKIGIQLNCFLNL